MSSFFLFAIPGQLRYVIGEIAFEAVAQNANGARGVRHQVGHFGRGGTGRLVQLEQHLVQLLQLGAVDAHD